MSGESPSRPNPRVQAAIEAYRRTLRNEAGSESTGTSAAGSSEARRAEDERLLAERPPHWASKTQPTPRRRRPSGQDETDG